MTQSTRIATLAGLVAVITVAAEGQEKSDSARHRNDCRLAAQVVEAGVPQPKQQWAFGYIATCRDLESKSALLRGLTSLRTSHDTGFIKGVTSYLAVVRDGDVFAAVLETARSNAASIESRIVSFMILTVVLDAKAGVEYERFLSPDPADRGTWGSCAMRLMHEIASEPGLTPMPADFRASVLSAARDVRESPSAPLLVRKAAACLG